MKKIEKYIMWILIFVAVGAIGAAVYFGIKLDKSEAKKVENKQEDIIQKDNEENLNENEKEESLDENKNDANNSNDNELVSFCENNKNSIILEIKEFRKNNFISKYYSNNFSDNVFSYKSYYSENGEKTELNQNYTIANANDIDCSSVFNDDDNNVIIITFEGERGGIQYNVNDKKVIGEYITDIEGDYDLNDYFSFIYAKDKMHYDLEQKYDNPGIYAEPYDGGDSRLFSVCNYGVGGERGCLGEKYAVYEYNYKTDTYYIK